MKNHRTEARDSGKNGLRLDWFLTEFNICRTLLEAREHIRAGDIALNKEFIKDVNYHVEPGSYFVKLKGELVAECTLL